MLDGMANGLQVAAAGTLGYLATAVICFVAGFLLGKWMGSY